MNCLKTGNCFNVDLYKGKQGEFPAGGLEASVLLNNMGLVEIPSNHSFILTTFSQVLSS